MVVTTNFDNLFTLSSNISEVTLPKYKPHGLKIHFTDEKNNEIVYATSKPVLPFAASDIYQAKIKSWRCLSRDKKKNKTVYEVTFNISGSNFQFRPGDTIGVIPQNDESDINTVLKRLNLVSKADVSYNLMVEHGQERIKIAPHVPVQSTLRYVLTHCVDLRSIVKKLFLLALSKYTEDEVERKTLELLCSKEGSDMYMQNIFERKLGFIDILNIFETCKPSIEVILANLPRLLPRPYSIANSQLKEADVLKICFSVLQQTNNNRGLTTGWLEDILNSECIEQEMLNLSIINKSMDKNVCIPIYLRKNFGFRIPENIESPLLLIAAGTGVAPFIGFLEEIMCLQEKGLNVSDIWLIFGCRDPKIDILYETEFSTFLQKGVLTKLTKAFSTLQINGIKYVQDAMRQDGAEVTKFILNSGTIFVCGDMKPMVTEVKATLIKCFMTHENKTREEAEKCITNLEFEKRFLIDLWS